MSNTRPGRGVRRSAIPAEVALRAATNHIESESGCHISTYPLPRNGQHPLIFWQRDWVRGTTTVSRAAWVHHNGREVPSGGRIYHTCANKTCVRAEHLTLVMRISDEQRFKDKVDQANPSDCWIWQGKDTGTGYGQFYVPDRRVLAHRWSYEHFVGPIPDGLHIDHLCRNRACVNPKHLEPVTAAENVRRAYLARERKAS